VSAKPPLHVRLREERIQGRKSWGMYVDLITQIRKAEAGKREQRIRALWQRRYDAAQEESA
jgi:ABC-type bacteriocin/lantibiotic exporter with double-glycine peptidase domain